ncbi:HAMP domain-containing histidine kinase [Lysobacter sp. 5GHs7-4]|uniref:sensor histidine kinase n=1 Tax=Lysobacter sp. 5GHs7-4 TaxID=2904253 RepID=UPI001E650941|nr:HAMP domain-containing sensor histidine kinase [Lysobacter sp. 5GHs7-4]UHQ23150.1 HAMP domain-containing histidine kinase [Lysobacter sp. 5GHs7-4]
MPRARDALLRRLHLRLTAIWTAAWLLCVIVLCAVAVATHARLTQLDLASSARLRATAVYGLTWFDADGRFHDALLRKEPGVLDAGSDIWVIAGGPPPKVLLRPDRARFDLADPSALAQRVLREGEDAAEEGRDRRGRPYLLQTKVTYDDRDRPVAAILVLADPSARDATHAAFVRWTLLIAAALAAFGILVGHLLSRRSLRPAIASFEQQERFIAAAAHELRTPVARLQALCETAHDGREPPAQILARVERVAGQTAGLVDQLLLLARLDAAAAPVRKEPVRLDLLVEAILPEEHEIAFEATESVVEADLRLVQTAVRNLIDNARLHGAADATAEPVRVTVSGRSVIVEDRGPGFPQALLERIREPFVTGPTSRGTGLGLAIVQHIAQLHGGELRLHNREGGGARVELLL